MRFVGTFSTIGVIRMPVCRFLYIVAWVLLSRSGQLNTSRFGRSRFGLVDSDAVDSDAVVSDEVTLELVLSVFYWCMKYSRFARCRSLKVLAVLNF